MKNTIAITKQGLMIKITLQLTEKIIAKSKNDKAVQALLDMDALKLTESGEIIGLKEQLESLQKNDPYLFESDKKVPEIIGSTQGSPIGDDDAAMRAAFGLPINKGE